MQYPYGTPAVDVTNIYTSTSFTPLNTTAAIIDNYTSIDKAAITNSIGKQVALIQNYVNSSYLGRSTVPVLSGYITNLSGTSIVYANATVPTINTTNLYATTLVTAPLISGAIISGVLIKAPTFSGTYLIGTNISGTTLTSTNIFGTTGTITNFGSTTGTIQTLSSTTGNIGYIVNTNITTDLIVGQSGNLIVSGYSGYVYFNNTSSYTRLNVTGLYCYGAGGVSNTITPGSIALGFGAYSSELSSTALNLNGAAYSTNLDYNSLSATTALTISGLSLNLMAPSSAVTVTGLTVNIQGFEDSELQFSKTSFDQYYTSVKATGVYVDSFYAPSIDTFTRIFANQIWFGDRNIPLSGYFKLVGSGVAFYRYDIGGYVGYTMCTTW